MLPTFETDRLILWPRTMDDLEACVTMDTNPEVMRYIPAAWDSPEGHRAFLRERISRAYPPELGYWSIFPKDDPADFLGWVHLLPVEGDAQTTEIGWRLKRLAWGKGYATEAAQTILAHAFETVGSMRVIAETHASNVRSKNMMQRLGLTHIADFMYGGNLPSSAYEITKENYSILFHSERM